MQIVNIQHRKAMIKYQGKSVGVVMRRCFIYNKEAVMKKKQNGFLVARFVVYHKKYMVAKPQLHIQESKELS